MKSAISFVAVLATACGGRGDRAAAADASGADGTSPGDGSPADTRPVDAPVAAGVPFAYIADSGRSRAARRCRSSPSDPAAR